MSLPADATETMVPRFALHEEHRFRAFLADAPLSIVLLRGYGCPYSATFERVFLEEPPPEGWTRAIREVEEGGHGPVGTALRVEVTPTVAAFTRDAEAARLPGKLLLGITRQQYRKWLRTLA